MLSWDNVKNPPLFCLHKVYFYDILKTYFKVYFNIYIMNIIGIKDLQTKTKQIREEVGKGASFIVVWRSKPIFEIRPFDHLNFIDDLKMTGMYNEEFIQSMGEAQEDIHRGRVTTHGSPEDFLQSLR